MTTEVILYPSQCIMMSMRFIIGDVHLDHLAEVVSVGLHHSNFFLRQLINISETYFETRKYPISPQTLATDFSIHQLTRLATITVLSAWWWFLFFIPSMFTSWNFFVRKRYCFLHLFIHSIVYISKDSWKFTEWNPTLLLSFCSNCSSSVHGELLHVGSSVFLTCAHSFSSTSSTLFSDTTGHSMLILFFSKVDSVPSIGEWCLESKI